MRRVVGPVLALTVAALGLPTLAQPANAATPAPALLVAQPTGLSTAYPQGSTTTGVVLDAELDAAVMSPDRATLIAVGREIDGSGSTGLWLLTTDGTRVKRLTDPQGGAYDAEPAVSPDGRKVAFTRYRYDQNGATTDTSTIWTLDLVEGTPVRIDVAETLDGKSPTWTPDGKGLVWAEVSWHRDPFDFSWAHWARTLRVRWFDREYSVDVPLTEGASHASVSRTGKVAFSRYVGGAGFRLETGDLLGMTRPVVWDTAPEGEWFSAVAWDAAGITLAAVRDGSGAAQVQTYTAPGGAPTAWMPADATVDALEPAFFDVSDAAPTVKLTVPAATKEGNATATVSWADSDDAIAGVDAQCRLDAGAWAPCTSAWPVSGAEGAHTLTVLATDPAGRTGTATVQWRVDRTAPKATLKALPTSYVGTSFTVSWSSTDAGGSADYQVRTRSAKRSGGFGSWSSPTTWTTAKSKKMTGAAGSQYCYSVRARDKAGNISGWTAESCVALVLDDKALKISDQWADDYSKSYAYGTFHWHDRKGQKASLSDVSARRLGVVVGTCSKCGKLKVTHNGKLLGTVNLRTSSTKYQQVLWLPSGSTRKGTVVLELTGGLVRLDGLVILH